MSQTNNDDEEQRNAETSQSAAVEESGLQKSRKANVQILDF